MAAPSSPDGPGRIVYLVVTVLVTLWWIHASVMHGLGGLLWWFLFIATVIMWVMAFALESNIMDRIHRNGFARHEVKKKAPYDIAQRDLTQSVGIVNWQESGEPGAH